MEGFQNFPRAVLQRDGAPVRTRHWIVRRAQRSQHPFHLALVERRVDLDRRAAGDRSRNPAPQIGDRYAAQLVLRDLEGVSSIVVTHQLRDAFYIATHMAVQQPGGTIDIRPATPAKEREAEFMMLRDGLIIFEGDAYALRSSPDSYIREFLS